MQNSKNICEERPNLLHKYYPPDRIDVLRDGKISYSPPVRFNDPFDSNPAVCSAQDNETLEQEWNKCREALPSLAGPTLEEWKFHHRTHGEIFNNNIQTDLVRNWNSLFGVFCVSENAFDTMMLSHYSDNHRGFIVTFDADNPFFTRRMGRVTYTNIRPILNQPDNPELVWMTKSSCWSYEKEWRSLEELKVCEQKIVNQSGGNVTIYLRKYPKIAVLRIMCGCNMSPETTTYLQSNLREWGYVCDVVKAVMHPTKYEFTFEKLSLV